MQTFKYSVNGSKKLCFTKNTDLSRIPEAARKIMSRFAAEKCGAEDEISVIETEKPISDKLKEELRRLNKTDVISNPDGYVIKMSRKGITVSADSDAGIMNGLMTFLRLLDDDGRYGREMLCDCPICGIRGIKLMIPARENIKDFYDFIDMMVFFHHNTLMLEIGGAMEYKRHPEINEGWEEYAGFMAEYSGKSKEIQEHTFPWRKNSIHCNNGGGSYLSQKEIRDMLNYCAERGITVIPEVPSTSHCDYLLTRHPELAERCEDPYPDTFCPSNPDSYRLLFDVLDEIIEVFHPEIVNIGHDEYYSINICDRCRKRLKRNEDIYAEDVIKIHDYLAAKNVKTMIWCDKLLDVCTEDGANFGGALNYVYKDWDVNSELLGIIQPTWKARERLPKDIICLNWFWSYGEKYDEDLREFPVIFGNFLGSGMSGFKKRCGTNTVGGICSNWGATMPVYLQRNNIYFNMAYNDILYWDGEYNDADDRQFEGCVEEAFLNLFHYHYGVGCGYAGKYIEVIHTTDCKKKHRSFSDGVFAGGAEYNKEYLLGEYVITYRDGTSEKVPVVWGENIGAETTPWYGKAVEQEAGAGNPGQRSARIDAVLAETAFTSLPIQKNGKVYYRYLIKKSFPEKKISGVEFISGGDFKVDIISVKEL